MYFIFSLIIYGAFVFISEQNNSSEINPYAASIVFTSCYAFVVIIFSQYFSFKKNNSKNYLIEFFLVFIGIHVYGSRLFIDSMALESIILAVINILFCLVFIDKIRGNCFLIPNVEHFLRRTFGEHPIQSNRSLKKIEPLIWGIVIIPWLSYALWSFV